MEAYNETLQLALDDVEQGHKSDEIEFENGVVLKLKKVSLMLLQEIHNKFEYPPVPIEMNEDKGRPEPNKFNAEWIEQGKEVDAQRTMAVMDAVVGLGTTLHYMPDDVTPLDSDDWLENLAYFGVPTPKGKMSRYIMWVKYIVAIDANDIQKLVESFGLSLGIAEGQIAAELRNNFPDNAVRDTAG